MNLRELSYEALLSDVTKFVGSHRELTAKLVAHLAEIEERRLHLLAGFSSMFEFCTTALRLGEGEAFRRILAARLGRRFPAVYQLLASGILNLSTLELLREWLTDDNHEELFAAVANKSKREVQAILASRFPRPDKPSKIRPATIEPLSEARFAVEFTASDALREKLERCRDLMSHANPTRDLAVVIERAVDLLLANLQRKRFARTKRPEQPHRARKRKAGGISNATRRAVFERDGLQCTYVAEDGRRCDARALLELDHVEPRAFGGSNDEKNLRVRCRAHNQLWAEQAFGREHVERSRHFCQKKRATEPPIALPFAKLQSALRGMVFRESEARKAVATVVGRHAPSESLTLEQALREAVLVATAA
jgi:5-methylcytosine-specific restriction endonuclease McrA